MKRSKSLSSSPSGQETLSGLIYLAFQVLVMPSFLVWSNGMLPDPLNDGQLNFVFYMINFLAMLLIFHGFLGRNMAQALRHPIQLCEAVILGVVFYYACQHITFTNYNDSAIFAMSQGNSFLMLIGTVVLVPPFEECMYRGIVFRKLYSKNKAAAYLLSMMIFSLIHILGYLRSYTPLEVLMATLQYLPAGLCLAWAYVRADTIFAPIIIHAVINYFALTGMR